MCVYVSDFIADLHEAMIVWGSRVWISKSKARHEPRDGGIDWFGRAQAVEACDTAIKSPVSSTEA